MMIRLGELAHGRAGDKGSFSNISVIAFEPIHFDYLVEHVTAEFCMHVFASRNPGHITRYLLPDLSAMNFVIGGILDGGVNTSLYLDRHGKGLSSLLLDAQIPTPPHLQEKDTSDA